MHSARARDHPRGWEHDCVSSLHSTFLTPVQQIALNVFIFQCLCSASFFSSSAQLYNVSSFIIGQRNARGFSALIQKDLPFTEFKIEHNTWLMYTESQMNIRTETSALRRPLATSELFKAKISCLKINTNSKNLRGVHERSNSQQKTNEENSFSVQMNDVIFVN